MGTFKCIQRLRDRTVNNQTLIRDRWDQSMLVPFLPPAPSPHYFTAYLRLVFYPCYNSCVLKCFPWTIDLKYEIICLTVTVLWVAGSAAQCTALLSLCFCWLCLITERWFIMQNSIPRHQDCHYCSSEVSLRVRSSPHCVETDLQNIWGAL